MLGRRGLVALGLLLLTIVTTTMWGAVYAYGYYETNPLPSLYAAVLQPRYAMLGFALYSLPLLLILGAHELGHYTVLRRAGLDASPPWFIPLPPPIGASGTFGAVINLRGGVPDRKTLVRVAAAGPLAGLAVATAALIVGFALTPKAVAATTTAAGGIEIQVPLLYDTLAALMRVPPEASVHPIAIAGWLGLFITAIQLIPAGQLDGGHLLRAFAGKWTRWTGWAIIVVLVGLALTYGFYGWLVFALIIWVTGLRQPPPVEPGPVGAWEIALALACLVTLVVTFVPRPFLG